MSCCWKTALQLCSFSMGESLCAARSNLTAKHEHLSGGGPDSRQGCNGCKLRTNSQFCNQVTDACTFTCKNMLQVTPTPDAITSWKSQLYNHAKLNFLAMAAIKPPSNQSAFCCPVSSLARLVGCLPAGRAAQKYNELIVLQPHFNGLQLHESDIASCLYPTIVA